MSMIDFKQEARDQGCLHIAVKTVGERRLPFVQGILNLLYNMPPVQLAELKGCVLFLRFLDESNLPCWVSCAKKGSSWEQLSAHKAVHGLLGVGHCQSPVDVVNAIQSYRDNCKLFQSQLCASKCILYVSKKGLHLCAADSNKDGVIMLEDLADDMTKTGPQDLNGSMVEMVVKELVRFILHNLKSRMDSLQKILVEPNRSDSSTIKVRVPMEVTDEELEQRQMKRYHPARMEKHMGDLCLLTGQLQNASRWYRVASEQLKSQKDWLWVGGAYEGLSVTAMMTKECEQVLGQKAQGVGTPFLKLISKRLGNHHSASLRSGIGGGTGSSVSLRPTVTQQKVRGGGGMSGESSFSRAGRYYSLKRNAASSPTPPDTLGHLDLQGDVISNRTAGTTHLGDEGDEEYEGIDGEGVLEELKQEEEEGVLSLLVDSRLLHKDFIETKFSLGLVCYKKAGKAGSVALLESSLKFAKYLVKQNHKVKAADTLQKTARIDGISDSEKLSLYQMMASIYCSMGYHRKEAMFTLYAAHLARSMATSNGHPFLKDAHQLLVRSLPGYRLSDDLVDLPITAASHIGWPSLQADVLKEFIVLSTILKEDSTVIIKCGCYLLQVLSQHMETVALRDVTGTIEGVAKKAHGKSMGSPSCGSTVIGKRLISPIPLSRFPFIRSFYPRPLITIMAPQQRAENPKLLMDDASERVSSPFIYSPFAPGMKEMKRKEVLWVEGDPAEIALSIGNPLPFELRVENMALMMEGAEVEIFPSSLTLPGESEQSQFALVSIPHKAGIVNVLGYEATVFGVYYCCHMKIQDDPLIKVIPKLPLLKVRSFLRSQPEGGVRGGAGGGGGDRSEGTGDPVVKEGLEIFDMMDGESREFNFELCSVNTIAISSLKVSAEYNKDYCKFSWDKGSLAPQLPLPLAHNATLHVSVQAYFPHRLIHDLPSAGISSSPKAPQGTSTTAGDLTLKNGTGPITLTFCHPDGRHYTPKVEAKSTQTDKPHNSLIDSLNLDRPHLTDRSNSSTLPNMSPSLGDNYKLVHTTRPSSKKLRTSRRGGGACRELGEESDIYFWLDKRASVRSDPGDRGQQEEWLGMLPQKAHISSNYNSPTSSVSTLANTDTLHPISIPNSVSLSDSDFGVGGGLLVKSDSSGKKTHGVVRNTSFQVGGSNKGNTGSLTRGDYGRINKEFISSPKKPLFKEVTKPLQPVKAVGKFVFEYSGGVGKSYYREVDVDVSVLVRPCLLFNQFDVCNCSKSQEFFELIFNAHNVSNSSLQVTCTVDQDGLTDGTTKVQEVMEARSSKRFCLLLRRFRLDVHGSDFTNTDLTKQYSKQMAKMLSFHWEVLGGVVYRSGHVTLEGLNFSVDMVTLMKPLHVIFSVSVNHEPYSQQFFSHSKNLLLGEMVRISIKLVNKSSSTLPVSHLVVEPYSSHDLHTVLKEMAGKMLHSGSLITFVPQLPPGASFEHEVCMSFLYKGSYLVYIKYIYLAPESDSEACDGGQTKKETSPSRSNWLNCSDGINKVAKSPLRVAGKHRPPPLLAEQSTDFPLTSSSLPVTFSLPMSSPPRSTPPPVHPKSAKAFARRFETEFATKRSSQPCLVSLSHPLTNRPSQTPNGPVSAFHVAPEDHVDAGHLHSEAPPPVPTSKRPTLSKTLRTTNASQMQARSHDHSQTTKSSIATLSKSENQARSSSASEQLLPSKVQYSSFTPSNSKYQHLLQDRTLNPGLVRVISGPNFSFHVS